MIRAILVPFHIWYFVLLRYIPRYIVTLAILVSSRRYRGYRTILIQSGVVERYNKDHTQTSTEMEVSCQRNGHLAVTNHVSGRGFVQATP